MTSTKYVLAADGGGTKTAVLCANEHGTVLGTGSSGPTNLTSTSVGAASFNLLEAIRQATEKLPVVAEEGEAVFSCLTMGLAGMDTEQEKEQAQDIFSQVTSAYHIEKFILVNDSVIALENATDAPNAIVLISGTGSNCFGRNSQGETAKTSGMDFLLTDQGSGYEIGRQVLREAVKSFDGRREKSLLEALVCQQLRIVSIAEIKHKVYNPLLSKIEIADFAPLCEQALQIGDAVAKDILDVAVDDLALMVRTVAKKLGFEGGAFDLVLIGSVVLKTEYVHDALCGRLQQEFPQLSIRVAEKEPVYGALKMALENTK